MNATHALAAIVSAQAGVIIGLALLVSRLAQRIARLEEWVRVTERRRNGA